ncbi:unnamed protein product [Nezara viridula]|uniref:Uncharacterized protein n=1 Tax=Nezara viridula TaxID=85310 RepID=A0A9P0E5D6_NEZVI|nr:unnamed protein product [Nezara viridula]
MKFDIARTQNIEKETSRNFEAFNNLLIAIKLICSK